MLSTYRINPLARAIGIIGVVAALVAATTFAALTSQATLTNNTIASATADLQVDSDGDASYGSTDEGFAFTSVVPGGAAVPSTPFTFKLKNNGGVGGTNLSVSVKIPVLPTWSGIVDNSKVDVVLACSGGIVYASTPTDLLTLSTTGVTLGSLVTTSGSEIADCTAQVQMDLDAFSGPGVNTTSGFTLEFTGTAV